MAKPKITRTYGPIHFEDLDPHRFEDLVRQLIYDFKEWQTIEATGRSGNDEGFDIRAYEKKDIVSQTEDEENNEIVETHPMEGNLWMIQGKREKETGPKRIKDILKDVDIKNLPYGYILAASSNFSKDSYDVFRDELRKKGVMEFYLWGKAELEDMLYLPKNDKILFTFFGISLVSRRRSRATEIRSIVNIKNKLYRVVGEGHQLYKSVLLRDLKDKHYPYEDSYKDFKKDSRWREYIVFEQHPIGLFCHTHNYFAYIDTEKKEWDYTTEIDLLNRQRERQEGNYTERNELVKDTWDFFPKANQSYFITNGLVKYEDIVVVDDKGDALYNFPHIYVDFQGKNGPFAGFNQTLKIGEKEIRLTDDYKKINVFPKKFKKVKPGKVYNDKKIILNPESLADYNNYRLDTLYDDDNKYNFLKPRDLIPVEGESSGIGEGFIQITHKFNAKIKDFLEQVPDSFRSGRSIELQLGRKFNEEENINVYEFRKIYKWQLEKIKK